MHYLRALQRLEHQLALLQVAQVGECARLVEPGPHIVGDQLLHDHEDTVEHCVQRAPPLRRVVDGADSSVAHSGGQVQLQPAALPHVLAAQRARTL